MQPLGIPRFGWEGRIGNQPLCGGPSFLRHRVRHAAPERGQIYKPRQLSIRYGTMIQAILETRRGLHQRRAKTGPPRDQTPSRQSGLHGIVRQSLFRENRRAGISPKAGFVLLNQIAPRLRATIPHVVRPTGAEDAEELLQDATAMAAQMLHSLEARGKEVTVGNVRYYVTLLMKSGRRSQSANRTDVLSPGAMLDGKSCALSLEEPVGLCSETGETVALGDLLAGTHEDPAATAARNIDWAGFLEGRDGRYPAMLRCAVSGQPMNHLKQQFGVSDSTLSTFKRNLATDIREALGEDILREVCRRPRWQAEVEGEQERMRCRHERQRAVC